MTPRDPPVLELSASTCDCLLPRPKFAALDWLEENGRLENGRPLSLRDYPWFAAVCSAWDDPRVRTITIQGAAQIGKTVLARNLLLMAAATTASNLMLATATQELARASVRKKIWPTLSEMPATRGRIPPRRLRPNLGPVDVGGSTIHVAWSGSPAKLGDLTIRFAHHGELDKWSRDASDEADPEALADDRVAAVSDHKLIKESTPSIAGASRINRRLLMGSNGQWHAPCPRCGEFQALMLGDGRGGGGLVWDKPEGGGRDPRLAEETARYVCAFCAGAWADAERMPALRAGRYVPEGQTARRDGSLEGEAARPWPHWSIQVSRFYSPSITWGSAARAYVEALEGGPELVRDHKNSWLGQTWSLRSAAANWETIAGRLCGKHELGVAPRQAVFATAGVDVQIDHVVYWVAAWGQGQTGWLIDYGLAAGWPELREVLSREYPIEGAGQRLPIGLALVDSRFEQIEDEVVEFCRSANSRGRWVWPSQGGKSGAMAGKSFYRREPDESGKRSKPARRTMADFYLVTVNTNYWQAYADRILYNSHAGDAGGFTFPAAAAGDQDLWAQLTNEAPEPGKEGPVVWKRISQATPVDLRDAWRYSRCAAEVFTLGAWQRLVGRRIAASAKPADQPAKPAAGPEGQTGGWFRQRPPRRAAAKRR